MADEIKTRASNRGLSALFLARDVVLNALPLPQRPHILLACMPKSGSTFLATALSELPALRRCRLTPALGEREQELCHVRLSLYNHRGYVAQHHIRNSAWTQHLIAKYHLTPVVLVRNLADCVISSRDHLRHAPESSPMYAFVPEHMKMSDAELEEVIVRMALPWYINFYMGWRQDKNALFVDYNDLAGDPAKVIESVLAQTGMSFTRKDVDKALSRCKKRDTRFNVGGSGRGRDLSPSAAKALAQLLDLYPSMKDDRLFIESRYK